MLVVHIHTTIITTMREKNWLQLIKSSWWYVVVVVVVHVMCTSGAFAYEWTTQSVTVAIGQRKTECTECIRVYRMERDRERSAECVLCAQFAWFIWRRPDVNRKSVYCVYSTHYIYVYIYMHLNYCAIVLLGSLNVHDSIFAVATANVNPFIIHIFTMRIALCIFTCIHRSHILHSMHIWHFELVCTKYCLGRLSLGEKWKVFSPIHLSFELSFGKFDRKCCVLSSPLINCLVCQNQTRFFEWNSPKNKNEKTNWINIPMKQIKWLSGKLIKMLLLSFVCYAFWQISSYISNKWKKKIKTNKWLHSNVHLHASVNTVIFNWIKFHRLFMIDKYCAE